MVGSDKHSWLFTSLQCVLQVQAFLYLIGTAEHLKPSLIQSGKAMLVLVEHDARS